MKNLFYRLRCLAAMCILALVASFSAIAQRTDSLMTKVDVIVPNVAATSLNGFVYYLADDGKTGYELWRTDGTKAGTSLVKDIRPGKASAFVSDSSFYYFTDYNTTTYTYDINATKVKNSLRAFRPYIHSATNMLYFWADNGINGIELWKSDGTEAGTQMVIDLIPGLFSTGSQYDILGGGYLNGTNGGTTNGYYYGWSFTPKGNKLLFWTSNVSNTVWETDGTAANTRDINFQPTKYRNSSGSAQVINGRTFITTTLYEKGKYYYNLLQDNGKTTTPLITNAEGYINILAADKRGLLYAVENDVDATARQYAYTIFRRDSATAKASKLKSITIAKPTTGTRSQYVYFIGQTANEVWLRAYDAPSTIGKGADELWRVDLTTDSVQRIKRYDYSQITAANETRLEKGSEAFYYYQTGPAGIVFLARTADTTSAYPGNRYTAQVYDQKSGKLQTLQDSLMYGFGWYNYGPSGQGGKVVFLSRKGTNDATQLWMTDGRTKQTIKTLGVYEYPPSLTKTDAGLVGVGYNSNKNKANKIVGYKVDAWKLDTTAAGTTRIGQATNYPGSVGGIFSSGTDIYGNYGVMTKLSVSAPDSIHFLADIGNYTTFALDGNSLGVFNGRIMSKVNGNLLAVDPKATPRKCLLNYTSITKASTYYNTKDLGYCPAKDSVITLKRSVANYAAGTGEISQIYYKNLTWLSDSTVLQTGSADSLKLRKQGQYALTLKGIADGCTATDTWKVYFSTPTVSQVPKLQNDRKVLASVITGGYPINGTNGYYSGKWERTTADGAVSQASTETGFNAASGARSVATAALDELVSNVYQPKYGVYTLKVTDANSCSATGTYNYTDKSVVLGLTAALSARNGADVCAGTPISYTATTSGGKAPYTYRWVRNGAPVANLSGATGAVVINTDIPNTDFNGAYLIEATDADGNKTYSNDLTYFVHGAPAINLTASSLTIPAGQSVTLTANCSNYQYPTFVWAKDNAVVTGSASRTLTATQAGVYSVTVGSGDKYGCLSSTNLQLKGGSGRVAALSSGDPVSHQGSQVLSVETGLNAEGKPTMVMQVIPNPSDGPTRVRLQMAEPSAVKGQVMDMQGRIIHRWEEPKSSPTMDMTIDLSPQPVGPYVIQVETEGKIHSEKVIKK